MAALLLCRSGGGNCFGRCAVDWFQRSSVCDICHTVSDTTTAIFYRLRTAWSGSSRMQLPQQRDDRLVMMQKKLLGDFINFWRSLSLGLKTEIEVLQDLDSPKNGSNNKQKATTKQTRMTGTNSVLVQNLDQRKVKFFSAQRNVYSCCPDQTSCEKTNF